MTTTTLERAASIATATTENVPCSIDELIRRRAIELKHDVLLGAPKQAVVDFEEHSALMLDQYVDSAVVKLKALGLAPVESSTEKAPVIGILAQSGIPYVVTIVALNRLGYTSFLISPRLSALALKQLLTLADCSIVLTIGSSHQVLQQVQEERDVTVKPMLVREDYEGRNVERFHRPYDQATEAKKVAVIIHSSGSTGLPKPIYLTNQSCIASFGQHLNMRGLIAAPMFHSNCFYETFRGIYSGKPLYYCNYAIPLTRQNLIDMTNATKPEIFHVVPYTIKLLAESDAGIAALAGVKMVLSAGSAIPDDLGRRLVERGVNLVANYGATETGRVMNSVRPEGDKDWDYLRILPAAKPYLLMDEISPGSGLYECVALNGLKSKSTVNTDDPLGAFRTRDLFIPHPTRPGLWKYASRMDDRFTLINGEKVLPLPIEGRIRQEEKVKEACVFGERHSMPGVLIVKADRAADMPDDAFVESIWPAVEAANSNAETFARIPRDLVVILPADTQYPQTDKGTFIRMQMYEQFKDQIEAVYRGFETSEGGTLVLEAEDLELYLLRKLKEQTGDEDLSMEVDFFAAGIDSLQCMQMWHAFKRELDLGGHQEGLSQNVLYETGNVKNLAAHLIRLREGLEFERVDRIEVMEKLIHKYSDFEFIGTSKVYGAPSLTRREVVLLTGATGGLGAHILAQLVQLPNVAAVWTAVRAATDDAASSRVRSSLEARGLVLTAEHWAKIIAVPSDLGHPDLGLPPSKLDSLSKTLTCVIHSAWAVNFNIPVQSFEAQHIKGVYNLIQTCLASKSPGPARFYFCSSVSSAGGTPRPGTVPEGPVVSPMHVQGTGYARSKYVAEGITLNAARTVPDFTSRVLRVGQLIGDTRIGEWNPTEGIPLMIQTAQTLGALPALDEEMTWLPVDVAANAIIELAGFADNGVTAPPDRVFQVLNPKRFHWAREMVPALASAGLKFETVPTNQWIERLRVSDRDPVKNPPIKLLNWFESKYGSKEGATKTETLVYLTEETVKASPALGAVADVLDKAYVSKVVHRLRNHWGTAS